MAKSAWKKAKTHFTKCQNSFHKCPKLIFSAFCVSGRDWISHKKKACSYAINILCGLWVNLGWTWMALKAHLICCDPLVVALSNNLKSKKYYLSKFGSNNSGKWGKMTHVIFDLLFSNKNYAQRATSMVRRLFFIEKTDKRERISKM